jgi:RNA polymerase sigma-70 factor (ECF subfamily)
VRSEPDDSFESLYAKHSRKVHALALRLLCNTAAADDVVQEVFVSIWRGLKNFRGDSSIGTWIHTITIRTAMRRLKWQPEAQLDDEAIARYQSIVRIALPDTRLELERAIAMLPTGARAVLLLHDVYGYKQTEIAESLGVALGTVKAQLHRARNLMKKELQR